MIEFTREELQEIRARCNRRFNTDTPEEMEQLAVIRAKCDDALKEMDKPKPVLDGVEQMRAFNRAFNPMIWHSMEQRVAALEDTVKTLKACVYGGAEVPRRREGA